MGRLTERAVMAEALAVKLNNDNQQLRAEIVKLNNSREED